MSQAQIEKFYAAAAKDPEMIAGLIRPNASGETFDEDGFIRSAVAKARELGYEFSFEEAKTWIRKQQDVVASGELSDSQLEAVAGGGIKSAVASVASTVNTAGDIVKGGVLLLGERGFEGNVLTTLGTTGYGQDKKNIEAARSFFSSW